MIMKWWGDPQMVTPKSLNAQKLWKMKDLRISKNFHDYALFILVPTKHVRIWKENTYPEYLFHSYNETEGEQSFAEDY